MYILIVQADLVIGLDHDVASKSYQSREHGKSTAVLLSSRVYAYFFDDVIDQGTD